MSKSSKKKKAADKAQTKKQIAIGRKQARQNRVIWLSVVGLVLLILAILAVGLIMEFLVSPAQPVARVDGAKIRTEDFQDLLTYQRYNQHMNILNMQNSLQQMDPEQEGNDFLISFYEQQLAQLQSSLALIPQNVVDQLIDDELIRQKAQELGITVTEQDVEQAINDDLRQAVAPPPQAPITDTEQIPTPTPVPQEQLDSIYENALASMGLADRQFRTIVQRSLLRQKVQEYLATQVPTTGLVAHVQLIQTDTEDEAMVAQLRIEGGEDFAIVAQEVSTDTLSATDGGDLGWVARDQLSPVYGQELEDAVFAMEAGEIQLVQSDDKFFVVLVLERDENGPLPEQVLYPKQASALEDWLAERKTNAEIERFLDQVEIPPDPFADSQGL